MLTADIFQKYKYKNKVVQYLFKVKVVVQGIIY